MTQTLPRFSRWRLAGVVAILSFGTTALLGAVGFGTVSSIAFILGFFILIPLIFLLGADFPLVRHSSGTEEHADKQPSDPVATLRRRYADGEITDAEFERRLGRLMEAERRQQDATGQHSDHIDAKLDELERE